MTATKKFPRDGIPDLARSMQILEQSIANGTHGHRQTVCGVCGQWCDYHYYTGFDGKEMCIDCAGRHGHGPKAVK